VISVYVNRNDYFRKADEPKHRRVLVNFAQRIAVCHCLERLLRLAEEQLAAPLQPTEGRREGEA
jgi:hypothetical protein